NLRGSCRSRNGSLGQPPQRGLRPLRKRLHRRRQRRTRVEERRRSHSSPAPRGLLRRRRSRGLPRGHRRRRHGSPHLEIVLAIEKAIAEEPKLGFEAQVQWAIAGRFQSKAVGGNDGWKVTVLFEVQVVARI